jgi:hypothetical protein
VVDVDHHLSVMAVFSTGGVMIGYEHRFKTKKSLFQKLIKRLDRELKDNGTTVVEASTFIAFGCTCFCER